VEAAVSSDTTRRANEQPGGQTPASGLIMIAGPSGAGKDTLIRLAVELLDAGPRLHVARRTVTRPANAFEDHASLEIGAFERHERAGHFALSWRAHGLAYGVPKAEIARPGALVLVSISRTVIETGRALYPGAATVFITAPPEVLAKRITDRGRDSSLDSRLARIGLDEEITANVDLRIDNIAAPEAGAQVLANFIRPRLPT
jgi:ribose 1,5-bisphosphokinase